VSVVGPVFGHGLEERVVIAVVDDGVVYAFLDKFVIETEGFESLF
jgi:hypothetical protein